MSGTTPNEGIVYPLVGDYADVQDWYQIAAKADALIRAYDATFVAAPRPYGFVQRSSANSTAIGGGSTGITTDVVEFDNSGAAAVAGVFTQPLVDPPSYWLFGCNVLFVTISGTLTAGDMCEAQVSLSTIDPVSGLSSSLLLRSKTNETNSGGEAVIVTGIAKIWNAVATPQFEYYGSGAGGAQKAAGAGSRFWGFRLGTAS